jgi:hypothetical protein
VISGVEVATASVFEELKVLEKVATDAEGLPGRYNPIPF